MSLIMERPRGEFLQRGGKLKNQCSLTSKTDLNSQVGLSMRRSSPVFRSVSEDDRPKLTLKTGLKTDPKNALRERALATRL